MIPSDPSPKKPSNGRLLIWLVGGGIGLYLVISGVVGIIANGA